MLRIISFLILIFAFIHAEVSVEFGTQDNNESTWTAPPELKAKLTFKPKDDKRQFREVPLFSETCDNIAYTGAIEQVGIDFLKGVREIIEEEIKPFTSMSAFEKAVFKMAFSWCLATELPERIEQLPDNITNALPLSADDMQYQMGFYTNPAGQAAGLDSKFTLEPLKTLLKASGEGTYTTFDGFMDDMQNCIIDSKERAVKAFYSMVSWNLNFKTNYISSLSTVCNFKLKREGETPSWENIIPSVTEMENDFNDYVNELPIGGNVSFSFGETLDEKSRCIHGINNITGKRCSTLRDIELAKLRKLVQRGIDYSPKLDNVNVAIKNKLNTLASSNLDVELEYDNLFYQYFNSLNMIYKSINLNTSGRGNKRVENFIEIFKDTYEPYYIVSNAQNGSKAYFNVDEVKNDDSIFSKTVLETMGHLNIIKDDGMIILDKEVSEIAFYKEAVVASLLYASEYGINTGKLKIDIAYKKNNNFNYKDSLSSNCKTWHSNSLNNDFSPKKNFHLKDLDIDYTKRYNLGNGCHQYYKNFFAYIESKMKPPKSYSEMVQNIINNMTEAGKVKDEKEAEINKTLLKQENLYKKISHY